MKKFMLVATLLTMALFVMPTYGRGIDPSPTINKLTAVDNGLDNISAQLAQELEVPPSPVTPRKGPGRTGSTEHLVAISIQLHVIKGRVHNAFGHDNVVAYVYPATLIAALNSNMSKAQAIVDTVQDYRAAGQAPTREFELALDEVEAAAQGVVDESQLQLSGGLEAGF